MYKNFPLLSPGYFKVINSNLATLDITTLKTTKEETNIVASLYTRRYKYKTLNQ